MTDKPMPAEAYHWHRKPLGKSRERCPLCDIAAEYRGEHRAIRADEKLDARHAIRLTDGTVKLINRAKAKARRRGILDPVIPRVDAVTNDSTLADFCDWNARQRGLDYLLYRRYRGAVRYVEESLGRTPSLRDLSQETLEFVRESMRASGFKSDTVNNNRWPLVVLWREAAKAGLAVASPPPLTARWGGGRKRPETPPGNVAPKENPDLSMSLAQYLVTYCFKSKLRNKTEDTRRQYEMQIDKFSDFLERDATLVDLDDDLVIACMGWLQEQGKAAATANKFRSHIVAMWGYAYRKHHVDQAHDVPKVAEAKRWPEAWSVGQVGQILASCQHPLSRAPLTIDGVPWAKWWTALVLTLYDAGGRISAVLRVKLTDLDLDTGRLMLLAENQKQKADQLLALSPQAINAIRASVDCAPHREFLFPWPMSKSMLHIWYDRILQSAGLPHGRRDKFHKLRRTSATQTEIALGPGTATRHLGHSSPKVTANYIDTSFIPELQVGPQLARPTFEQVGTDESCSIASLLPEFREAMLRKAGADHANQTATRAAAALAACEFTLVSDLDGTKTIAYLDGRRREGVSGSTCYNDLAALRAFGEWLVRDRGFNERAALFAGCLVELRRNREWII